MDYKILFAFVSLIGCKTVSKNAECEIANGDNIIAKPFKTSASVITYDGSSVHDTIAIDLLIRVTDLESGTPVSNVQVRIAGKEDSLFQKLSTTAEDGQADFIAFYNGGGTFILALNHPDYSCVQLNDLSFSSGQIIRLDVRLKKIGK